MWFSRRRLRLTWTERVNKDEVLEMNTIRTLILKIRKQPLKLRGNVMRKEGVEYLTPTRHIEGKSKIGHYLLNQLGQMNAECLGELIRQNTLTATKDR